MHPIRTRTPLFLLKVINDFRCNETDGSLDDNNFEDLGSNL